MEIKILYFKSESCAPCKALLKKVENFSNLEKINLEVYEVSDNLLLCNKLNVFSAPTILVYLNDKLFIKESGYFSFDLIVEKIKKYEELF